ncbi:PREDICTED: syntaxin-10 isoform X2 [Miniopterus natalensis]|uniref:syntaxin-10 isoform X2 n=1 Tax=Miniopterus natalensis TaxID=291302 RepID=UPI0007A725BB|nr:PREDICTED: syntaxin-10 isoform X2 [Miniopterus natalensis]
MQAAACQAVLGCAGGDHPVVVGEVRRVMWGSSEPPVIWGRSGGLEALLPHRRARCAPACSEVQKAVNTARGLYQRWCELLQEGAAVGREELDWTTNELRNGLRSIEWDLEDLEETIGIVEANPGKFRLPAGDLQERRVFVERMREAVQEMKDHMVSPAAIAFMERNNREMLTCKPAAQKSSSDLLDASMVSATSRYIEEQQATQQLIMDQQDEQLEMVSGSIRVLKHMSGRVGEELDEQACWMPLLMRWTTPSPGWMGSSGRWPKYPT